MFVITSLLAETPAAMFGAAAVIFAGLFILFGANPFHRRGPVRPRLAVLERTAVDRTRSIALIRWDDAEYLILVGGPQDMIVEKIATAHDPETGGRFHSPSRPTKPRASVVVASNAMGRRRPVLPAARANV